MKWSLLFLFLSLTGLPATFAGILTDSIQQRRFKKLATQMGLKEPKLKPEEYEVRIWQTVALKYGDAHLAYILRKTKKRFTVVKYLIESTKDGFQYAIRVKPTVKIVPALWDQLQEHYLLTLPNLSTVLEEVHAKQPKDSTWNEINNGEITVKARRSRRKRLLVLDGEGYSFEVFGHNTYRSYGYSNPFSYIEAYPESEVLHNVTGILNDLSIIFRSDQIGR
jgi:hypothetical protein